MKNRIWLTTLLAALTLAPALGEQISVRNRPFKGAVSSQQGAVWVELKPFAEALDANLVDNGQGGYGLSLGPITAGDIAEVPANKLRIGQSTVDVQVVDGAVQAPLAEVARLVNARVIVNKQLGTIDVNMPTAAMGGGSTTTRRSSSGSTGGNVLHIHGHIALPGANQVGLFTGGDSSSPYKTGSVDSRGNYSIDVDLDKDLRPEQGVLMADMRFFRNGAFGECHGVCNFLIRARGQLMLQVYGGPTIPIKGNDFEYTEKD